MQIQVLLLIRELQRELGIGVIFVTHDLGVAVEVSDRIGVMYAGRSSSWAASSRWSMRRAIPTRAACSPRRCMAACAASGSRRSPGAPPDLAEVPTGCSFAPRCKYVEAQCLAGPPALTAATEGHLVRCVGRVDSLGA